MGSARRSGASVSGTRESQGPQRRSWWREPLFGKVPYTKREQRIGLVVFACAVFTAIIPPVRRYLPSLLPIALPAWVAGLLVELLAIRRRGRVRLSSCDPRWSLKQWSTLQALTYQTVVVVLGLVDGFVLGHRELHFGASIAILALSVGAAVAVGGIEGRVDGRKATRA